MATNDPGTPQTRSEAQLDAQNAAAARTPKADKPFVPKYMVAEFRENPLETVNVWYVGDDDKAAQVALDAHIDAVCVTLHDGGHVKRKKT